MNVSKNENATAVQCTLPNEAFLWLLRIVGTVVILAGNTGNVLIVIIKMQPLVRRSNSAIYLVALAITDECSLLMEALRYYTLSIKGYDTATLSSSSCKMFMWLQHSFQYSAAWILIAFNIERCARVVTPLVAITKWTHTALFVACIAFFWLMLNSYRLNEAHVIEYKGCVICSTAKQFKVFNLIIWPWLHLTFDFILPCACFAVCHLLVASAMRKRREVIDETLARRTSPRRTSLLKTPNPLPLADNTPAADEVSRNSLDVRKNQRSRRVTFATLDFVDVPEGRRLSHTETPFFWALLVVDLTFAILIAPRDIYSLFWIDNQHELEHGAFYTIASVVASITHASKFYIFFVMSRTFQEETRMLMKAVTQTEHD